MEPVPDPDESESAPGIPIPEWVVAALVGVVGLVTVAEFALDLDRFPRLQDAVVVADVFLVTAYALWVSLRAWEHRQRFLAWLVDNRLDVILVVLAVGLSAWAPRAGIIALVLRLALAGGAWFGDTQVGRIARRFGNLSPSQTLALSFLGLIAIGALFLLLPAATADGKGASITDAVFTMASATSVTGLIVQDTGTYFSRFGLVVIAIVMQTGAIGIMILAASFAVLVGGRLPFRGEAGVVEEAGFHEVQDIGTVEGIKRLATSVTGLTLAIEAIGAAILYLFWLTDIMPLRPEYDDPTAALWWCVFHSISAFCHAGFSLEPDSLVRWQENQLVTGVFMVLITLGAFGFPVLADLFRRWGTRGRSFKAIWRGWHIQTRVVIVATFFLNLIGMLAFLFFEYEASLSGLSIPAKVNAALFQSITTRSAGFNTVDIGAITMPTLIIFVVFFFIGSAPASTGGGIRITTASVVVLAVRAMLRGREDVEVFGRTLPKSIVYRSIAIVLIGGMLLTGLTIMVVATQDHLTFEKLIFESASAFGTVGLSMGITSELDNVGKWLVALLMYIGRVGPLTLALAVGERTVPKGYRYPEGRMAVG
jgi:trk system potassium uptake protein TrkH